MRAGNLEALTVSARPVYNLGFLLLVDACVAPRYSSQNKLILLLLLMSLLRLPRLYLVAFGLFRLLAWVVCEKGFLGVSWDLCAAHGALLAC